MVKRTPKAPKTEKKVLKEKTGKKTAVKNAGKQKGSAARKNSPQEYMDNLKRFEPFMDRYPDTRFFMPSLIMLAPEKAESIRKAVEDAEKKKKGSVLTTEELQECLKQNNAYLHLEVDDKCCDKCDITKEEEKEIDEILAELASVKAGDPETARNTILLNYFNNHLSEFKSPEELKAALDKAFPDKKPDPITGKSGFFGPGLMTGWGGVPAGAENLRPMLGAYINKDTDGLENPAAEKKRPAMGVDNKDTDKLKAAAGEYFNCICSWYPEHEAELRNIRELFVAKGWLWAFDYKIKELVHLIGPVHGSVKFDYVKDALISLREKHDIASIISKTEDTGRGPSFGFPGSIKEAEQAGPKPGSLAEQVPGTMKERSSTHYGITEGINDVINQAQVNFMNLLLLEEDIQKLFDVLKPILPEERYLIEGPLAGVGPVNKETPALSSLARHLEALKNEGYRIDGIRAVVQKVTKKVRI